MISRYTLYATADLSNYFEIAAGLPKGIKPHYNISPTLSTPVIVNRDGARVVQLMKWGLVAKGAKDTHSVFRYKTYNIESEKIFSRHSWETAVRERRCLVPANGFYQLNESGKKRAFYLEPKDGELFAFAGVYSSWQDPQGETHGTFSVITVESARDMPSPGYRMPVVIKREDEARWLDASVSDLPALYDMMRTFPGEKLNGYEVSPAVHSPKPNGANLIEKM